MALFWSLHVPNKVKVFGWWASHNIIPTIENLQRKRVSNSAHCLYCLGYSESILHVLRDCNFAREVWSGFTCIGHANWSSSSSTVEWFMDVLASTDQETFCQFIINLVSAEVRGGDDSSTQWTPPSLGNAKINFDAAIFNDLDAIGIGVAIRDSDGEVLALLSCKKWGLADPFVAECFALKEALKFALEIGIREVEVEGEYMLTVCAIKNSHVDHSIAAGIVESSKDQIPSFNKFKIRHVKRAGNAVAHSLAKYYKAVEDFKSGWKKCRVF
ncbi:hypothetical protein REPUB_Repub11eG0080100 [Reevesia pubescens]